jgi:hypothetical protein
MKQAAVSTLLFLALIPVALAQSTSGSIGGVVRDPSQALIPGVTIAVTNTQTGIVTSRITNESGVYNVPGLLPGIYKVTADLPGFRQSVYNEVQLGTSAQIRLDFTLQVGAVTQSVEVSVASDSLLRESSASIGEVLPAAKVQELPLVTGNVLDLVRVMAGVRSLGGEGNDTFAGVSSDTGVNTVRDGLSVSDGRFSSGIYATTVLNPDLIGEIRVILSPVDAELGRGNGQVQLLTRSGTNRYTGAAVWNVRNSALNGNTWNRNNDIDPETGLWRPTPPDWYNEHQYTLSFGGPIIRNKTFFFALWDQQIERKRTLVQTAVLTDSARNGVFRYFDGWNNGNAGVATNSGGTNPTRASVDLLGNPLNPGRLPNGNAYTGSQGLRCFSVFGDLKADGSPFTAADCPGGTISTNSAAPTWDPRRTAIDPTGFVRKFLDLMPRANAFVQSGATAVGDGLNTAVLSWWRRTDGPGGAATQIGTELDHERRQINLKFDHNFSEKHKANLGYTLEMSSLEDQLANWPNGVNGETVRRPWVLTANFTSTLSSTLVNEARFGIRYNFLEVRPAWEVSDKQKAQAVLDLFIPGSGGYSASFSPGSGGVAFTNSYYSTQPGTNGNYTPLYSYADTLSWTRGTHAFKFGGEVRISSTNGYNTGILGWHPTPSLRGGAGGFNATGISTFNATTAPNGLPGLTNADQNRARDLLYFLAGSVNEARMMYWIDSPDDVANGRWEDYLSKQKILRDIHSNEFAAFIKDDWKVLPSLTLNLGLRYEYYGSPYISTGFTSSIAGQGNGLWGVFGSENAFQRWLAPGNVYLTGYGPNVNPADALKCVQGVTQSPLLPTSNCDPAKVSTIEFVGPNSPNPDKSVFPNDLNNFGPAVGFAWQVPWFGAGKTTVRGGYQMTYGGTLRLGGNAGAEVQGMIGNSPGSASAATTFPQDFAGVYLDLRQAAALLPVLPLNPALPGGQVPIYDRSAGQNGVDVNWVTPYTQNFTLSVTRNVRSNLTLDVRYIGTQSKKMLGSFNLNEQNIFLNQELFDALEAARRGQNSPLLDQMFAGLNLNSGVQGYGPVGQVTGGVLQTGTLHLRRWQGTNLANGNYDAIASALNGNGGAAIPGTGAGSHTALPAGIAAGGRILRNSCNRIASGWTTVGGPTGGSATPLTRCFPENYLVANPQFGSASYRNNNGFSNYHSVQAQVTLRPTLGMSIQATHTWSKAMGLAANSGNYTDLRNWDLDYQLSSNHSSHDFRANGTFELPLGPNKMLLANSTGWLARLVERWQASVILNMNTGGPASISATQTLWANGRPNVVGPWEFRKGDTQWGTVLNAAGDLGGKYFGNNLVKVEDPACAPGGITDNTDAMGFNLRGNFSSAGVFSYVCTNDAVADATTGQILLQNAAPGTRGSLGSQTVEGLGDWSFDGSMSKTIRLGESKSLQVRVDATNVFNHPKPNAPTLDINGGNVIGTITGKNDAARTFQGQLRFSF